MPGRLPRTDGPLLTVVVPTRNEAGNVDELVRRLRDALPGTASEIIFVDDSSDDTPAAIERQRARPGIPVRLIHRPLEQRADGLGGAVVRGMRAARSPWVCVLDADLQHPPELVRELLGNACEGNADLALASRYRGNGSGGGLGAARTVASRGLIALTRAVFPLRLRGVTDPLSGFFVVRVDALSLERLHPRGFKILLEILVRTQGLRVTETPFVLGKRIAGQSKANLDEGVRYLGLLWRLRFGAVGERLGRFGLVGLSGLVVNMLLFALLAGGLGMHYLAAAILATQGSTLWNFVLTELWVFSDRRHRRRGPQRLWMYFVMNNVAFALRGPLLVGLTDQLGLHYLTSNVISLLALTLARFAVADLWIWARREPDGAVGATHVYDLHRLVTVDSEVELPELARFASGGPVAQPTVRVRVGALPPPSPVLQEAVCRYQELGSLGFAVELQRDQRVDVLAAPLLRYSPHVLYTNVVEPVLRHAFVEQGVALVHGACLEARGEALLVTARTDTGKTTTVLRVLDADPGLGFLSDDLTLLAPDGTALAYPKPLTISSHTAHAVRASLLTRRERVALAVQSRVHSRSGRRLGLLLTRLHLPVATINLMLQAVVPPPKYDIERLVPHTPLRTQAQLRGLVVLERSPDEERELAPEEAVATLAANSDDAFAFPPYEQLERFLRHHAGRDLRAEERTIVERALAGVQARLVRSERREWWRRVGELAADPGSDGSRAEPAGTGGRTVPGSPLIVASTADLGD